MPKVRITVLKTDFDKELADTYGDEGLKGPCPCFQVGDVIECERHYQPEGFCGEAWKCIQHYVYALYHGAQLPFGKNWMRDANVAIATCNDGIRPVTFKLERID